jgi:DNA-binding response OmpR family regulator
MLMSEILLLDPSPTIGRLVEMTFKGSGHSIHRVSSASEAEHFLINKTPSAVIINYNINGLSGIVFCKRLANNPKTSNIPRIMLGGSFSPFDADEAFKSGADEVVMKPFKSDELRQPVLSLIEVAKTQSEAPQPEPVEKATPELSAESAIIAAPAEPKQEIIETSKDTSAQVPAELDPEILQAAVRGVLRAELPTMLKKVLSRLLSDGLDTRIRNHVDKRTQSIIDDSLREMVTQLIQEHLDGDSS